MLTDKLKKYREDNNLTQEELADKLYVSRSTIAKWEQGRGIPGKANLSELSKLFKIDKDELLEEDEAVEVIECIEKRTNKKISILLAILVPIIFILIICLPISIFYGFKNQNIISRSVSPDGNIKLTVFNKSNRNGYEIKVDGIYSGTWSKHDSEFVGLYWSYDSRFVVEVYRSSVTQQNWLECTDFKENSGRNLQLILETKLADYYSISETEIKCEFDFVQWSDEEDIMLIKFRLWVNEENISGYFWSSPYLVDECNTLEKLSGLTEISKVTVTQK